MSEAGGATVMEARSLGVRYGDRQVLHGADISLRAGEVHALMGENGAGKSTLIRALAGVVPVVSGEVLLDGGPVRFSSAAEAQTAGVVAVLQDVPLVPHLSVGENVMLGQESRGRWGIDRGGSRRRAEEMLGELGLDDLDTRLPLHALSPAARQLVAIARAVATRPRVLLLDEPTSSLDSGEVSRLFGVIDRLRDQGVAMVFASHHLEQVFAVSDRVTVLRNGRLISEAPTRGLDRAELIAEMIGHDLEALRRIGDRRRAHRLDPADPPYYAVRDLGCEGVLAPTDLDLHCGEIVGVAGLRGSGRSELARLLAGALRADSGTRSVAGRPVRIVSPETAMRHRIAMATEDRLADGVIPELDVRDNVVLALQALRGWTSPLSKKESDDLVGGLIEDLGIRPADPSALVGDLSGGNQQKVLLARWLATRPRILILDEPTKGVDIRSRVEIQEMIARLAVQGMGIMVISSDFHELVRLCDRVVVMKDRAKIGEVSNGPGLTADTIVEMIAAVEDEDDDLPPLIPHP